MSIDKHQPRFLRTESCWTFGCFGAWPPMSRDEFYGDRCCKVGSNGARRPAFSSRGITSSVNRANPSS